ncbi:hypothetical protein OIO90_001633 [Microbotryomycetes sp. JL221]|nr:hypothetical protein OIO90_001633 [Microbotryomycetes sp. JL221]
MDKVDVDKCAEQQTAALPVEGDFPEGGTRAYLTVAGGFMALFASFGLSNSYGVLNAYFEQNQLKGQDSGTIALLGSVHLFFAFGSGIVQGGIFDRGYFRYQLLAGSLLWILGSFSLAFAHEYYQFMLAYSVTCGLGLGSMFSPTMSCVGTYFLAKRAQMVGYAASGASLGAVAFPLILNNLFESIGYRNAILTISGLSTVLLVAANAIMRPRKFVKLATTSSTPKRTPTPRLLLSFLRQPMSWITYVAIAMSMGGGMFVTLFFVQSFARENGVNETLVKSNIAILNAIGTVCRLGAGPIADRLGVFNTALPITLLILGATSTAGAIIWDIAYGIPFGSFVVVMSPMWMSLARSPGEIGSRVGLGSLFVACAALICPPIAGRIRTASDGQYWAPLTFGGVTSAIGTGLLLVARFKQAKKKQTWKV